MKRSKKGIKSKQIDTYSDDRTVAEFLRDANDPNYRPPYRGKEVLGYFSRKHGIKKTTA
jgi:hypothetical protein